MIERLTPAQARRKHRKAFDAFWAAYPKHVAPTEAERVFSQLAEQGADLHHIVKAAKRYSTEVGEDLTYVPAPHRWLQQGRYDDTDLFADESEAQLKWLRQQWSTANVKAVEDRFQISMPKVYPPDEIFENFTPGVTVEEALSIWFKEQARLWITEVVRSKFPECQTSQPTTPEQNAVSSVQSSTIPESSAT
ncbi:hypothetical protein [Mycolicibacterium palauense]|uniref:hypothetical protein n=1 Tax=Mycolicibacterium palauense TaxID=2034511 RepID=UPI001C3F22FD|nr:hypothetical protein [Mycolicibacterium palauense]